MTGSAPFELRTARLLLRPLAPDDLDALHPVLTDEAVRRHLFDGETISRDFLRAAIENSTRHFAERGWGLYGIVRGDDGVRGVCGFHMVGTPPERQLVYALAPELWGQGYGREAVGAVVGHVRSLRPAGAVVADVDASNRASAALLRALGFKAEVRMIARGRDIIRFALPR